jgi:hypothetical protein
VRALVLTGPREFELAEVVKDAGHGRRSLAKLTAAAVDGRHMAHLKFRKLARPTGAVSGEGSRSRDGMIENEHRSQRRHADPVVARRPGRAVHS